MRFALIARHRHVWPVGWPCAAIGVSRSGFHAWLNRPVSARAAHDERIGAVIRKSFKDSDRTYGARRIWRDVLEAGLHFGLHRVERLMRGEPLWRHWFEPNGERIEGAASAPRPAEG